MSFLEWSSLIISGLALGFSIFTYRKHDSIIKKQEQRINSLQLEKLEREKEKNKRAIIEANVIREAKGKRIIKVYNRGRVIARNVKVDIPQYDNVNVSSYPYPIDIKPQNSIEIKISTFKVSGDSVAVDSITVDYTWDDNLKSNNIDQQTLQI